MWSAKLVFQGNEDLFNTPECSWIFWTGTYCRVLEFVKTFTRVSTAYHGWSNYDVWISGGYQPLWLTLQWIQRTSSWNCSCPFNGMACFRMSHLVFFRPEPPGVESLSTGCGWLSKPPRDVEQIFLLVLICVGTPGREWPSSLEISNRWYSCAFFGFTLW